MENIETYFVVGGVLNVVGKLIIIAACIILVIKQKNSATILMLVGSVLSAVLSLAGIVWAAASAYKNPEAVLTANGAMSILKELPYILFALGLILYAIKYLKKYKEL